VRRAGYQPRERKFAAGDLVYLRRQPADSIDVSVSRGAHKVHQVGARGYPSSSRAVNDTSLKKVCDQI
jgi:hypothetical protein